MSFVNAAPDRLVAAARNLAGIGSTLSASNATAAAPTLAVSAAASDQVSAAVAAFFSGHAQGYQTLSAQAAKFHNEFVQALSADANSYAAAESANASPLQQLFNAASDTTSQGNGEAVKAAGPPSAGTGVPCGAGAPRGGTANQRSGAAGAPVGAAGSKGAGTGSSTEGGAPGGNCGSGGVLLRPGGVSQPVSWTAGAAKTGASGGLLSRLVDGEGGSDRSGGVGRVGVGTRNGVWLDGIRGAGAATGAHGSSPVQRGLGAGGNGGPSSGTGGVGAS